MRRAPPRKSAPSGLCAICAKFPERMPSWRFVPQALKRWDQKFAKPVALSSIVPGDFPLPRTTLGFDFDLLELRAWRMKNVLRRPCPIKPAPA